MSKLWPIKYPLKQFHHSRSWRIGLIDPTGYEVVSINGQLVAHAHNFGGDMSAASDLRKDQTYVAQVFQYAPEMRVKLKQAAACLEPITRCVRNDNGDITVERSHLSADELGSLFMLHREIEHLLQTVQGGA